MNKILEEEGTCERSEKEEIDFCEHEASVYLDKKEDEMNENANYLFEYLGL